MAREKNVYSIVLLENSVDDYEAHLISNVI